VAPVSGMTKRKVCVGESDNMVTPENAGDCSKPTITRLNEGLTIDVVCVSKQGKQSISSSFTGDFDTHYRATLKTTFDPPSGGIPHMGVKLDGISARTAKRLVAARTRRASVGTPHRSRSAPRGGRLA
jgi:hypothetical protein